MYTQAIKRHTCVVGVNIVNNMFVSDEIFCYFSRIYFFKPKKSVRTGHLESHGGWIITRLNDEFDKKENYIYLMKNTPISFDRKPKVY